MRATGRLTVSPSERPENVCDRSRRASAGIPLARRDSRDALVELADGSDQPRPDRDDGDRRHDDGPRRPRHARRRRARRQPLFRAVDLRARPDERGFADDGSRARPQPPCGARDPPHCAAGAVDRRAGLHPDLADPVEHRGDSFRHGAGSRAGQGSRRLRSLAAMGGAAFLRLHHPALLHGGARAAALGAAHRGHRGDLQRLRQLVPDLRQSRLSRDGHLRLRASPPRCQAS